MSAQLQAGGLPGPEASIGKLALTDNLRRIADYPDAFAPWNLVASLGSYVAFTGLIVFLFGIAQAFARRQHAPANPWGPGATTLEWTLSSPPPFHQFNELPVIKPDAHH